MSILPRSPYLHTVDVVVMRYIDHKSPAGNGLPASEIQVLLNKREHAPFANEWALPGLVVNGDQQDVSIDQAAVRLMKSEKVGIEPLYMEQVGTEGNGERDPRCWSSTTFYMAFVDADVVINENQRFIPLKILTNRSFLLPFDHNTIITMVEERLVSKSRYSSLPLLLLGRQITLTESCDVMSCVLGKPVQKSSMRIRLDSMTQTGFLEVTEEKKASKLGRSQVLINNLKPGEVLFFDRCIEK